MGIFLLGALWLVSLPASADARLNPSSVSFLGGKGRGYQEEAAKGVAVDRAGATYVAWNSGVDDLPFRRHYGDAGASMNAIVTKISPEGRQLLYHVGIGWAVARAIALDAQGNVFIVGDTECETAYFCATNAVQPELGGNRDAFVAKFSADDGQLLYCTYLGGSDLELGTDIAVDSHGHALVTGWTTSTNFPVTPGAVQPTNGGLIDAFVVKLGPQGTNFIFSTYLGGTKTESGASIAVDANDRVWVAGSTASSNFVTGDAISRLGPLELRNAYLARLDVEGARLEALVLIGGNNQDFCLSVALDLAGNLYLLGLTHSPDFPATPGCVQPSLRGDDDYFLAKLNPVTLGLIYATFLGGSAIEKHLDYSFAHDYFVGGVFVQESYLGVERAGLAVDAVGNAYLAASTLSDDVAGSLAANPQAGDGDAFLAKVNPTGTALLYFSHLGGPSVDQGWDVALRGADDGVMVGSTMLTLLPPHFPTTVDAFQSRYGGSVMDAFVARYTLAANAPPNDAFGGRIMLTNTMLTVRADNRLATTQPGEPDHHGSGKSLWWSWQAPADGRLFLSTVGSRVDTAIGVYSGNDLSTLARLALSDSPDQQSLIRRLIVPVGKDTVYLIAMDSLTGAGELALSLTFSGAGNDDVEQRTSIAGFPVHVTGSNVFASFQEREDLHERYARHSLWWSWTPPSSGVVRLTTEGSDVLSVATAYEMDAGGQLQRVGGAVDGENGAKSAFTFMAVYGKDYAIAMDGYSDETGILAFNLVPGIPPPNDNFTNAVVLTGWDATAEGTNSTATFEPGESFIGSGRTVWWTWIAPTNGYAKVSTEGSDFRAVLAVFTGNELTHLTLAALNDNRDGLSGWTRLPVQNGVAYRIQVDAIPWVVPGSVKLSIQMSQPAEILPLSLQRSADGSIAFAARAIAGHTYRLESSSDLRHWTAIGNPLSGVDLQVTDIPVPAVSSRFYRLADQNPRVP